MVRPSGYFANMDERELTSFYKENYSGKTRTEIRNVNPDFVRTLRKRGLIDIIPSTLKKPKGYWKELDNVIYEAKLAMEEQGWDNLPSGNVLEENGYSSLKVAIRHHGGMGKFCNRLGIERKRKTNGYWLNEDNLKKEIRIAIQKEGWNNIPSQEKLYDSGYGAMAAAISNFYGTFNSAREALGYETSRRVAGQWNDVDYALQEAKEAMEKEGWKVLPSKNKLEKKGYAALSIAINRKHRGIRKFRNLMGDDSQVEKGSWKNLDFALKYVANILLENNWDGLPNYTEIKNSKYANILNPINKYHGGFPFFREKLNQYLGRGSENGQIIQKRPLRHRKYWNLLENRINEARAAMEEENWTELPGGKSLTNNGYGALARAISRNEGFPEFREELNRYLGRKSEKQQVESLLEKYIGEAN